MNDWVKILVVTVIIGSIAFLGNKLWDHHGLISDLTGKNSELSNTISKLNEDLKEKEDEIIMLSDWNKRLESSIGDLNDKLSTLPVFGGIAHVFGGCQFPNPLAPGSCGCPDGFDRHDISGAGVGFEGGIIFCTRSGI